MYCKRRYFHVVYIILAFFLDIRENITAQSRRVCYNNPRSANIHSREFVYFNLRIPVYKCYFRVSKLLCSKREKMYFVTSNFHAAGRAGPQMCPISYFEKKVPCLSIYAIIIDMNDLLFVFLFLLSLIFN